MATDFDTLVTRLRKWTKRHDPHVRAAVELLIEHKVWIRRAGFRQACVHDDRDGTSWIDWEATSKFAGSGPGSETEVAILRLAVDIGSDRYRFSRMGPANSWAIVSAIAAALGEEVTVR